MGDTNLKGDIGEIKVIQQALELGYKVAIPYGHDWKSDIIVERLGELVRVQVKTTESLLEKLIVRITTVYTTGERTITRPFQEGDYDWLAIYDIRTNCCYFLHSSILGQSKTRITLRFLPSKNNQTKNIRWAADFLEW